MSIDEDFHPLIIGRSGAPEIAHLARNKGMRTMFEDGIRLCQLGETTLAEVLRATRAGER
jgi:type II secretory ATPase GspE/PulE/Tfp pilus assembly ATPase PilB-like protein